ncbi:MAG: hypothetical protein DRP84_04740 [Spirochaetes bacterium]|nr:MAG: hypothetical protein DRP84_04740 [Spirochaetota bacterium]
MKKLECFILCTFILLIINILIGTSEVYSFNDSAFYGEDFILNSDIGYDRVYELKMLKKTSVKKVEKKERFTFFGYGSLNFGEVTYYPFIPVEGNYDYTNAFGPSSPKPYNFSYGFGIAIDYRIMDFLGIFLDGGSNSWKLLLAKKDGDAYGQWVAEATDYDSAVVGPFSMDTYYYMDTVVLRTGARYIASKGLFQPWIGAGIGMSAWQATIGNRQEQKKIGNISSGISIGYSFLGGTDLVFKDFVIRLYIDYGSALAYPKISGLLKSPYDSAVFEPIMGEHATGPYKVGLAFGVKY